MKHYINKIALLLACGFATSSCIHDNVDDIAAIGKVTPTVYWEKVPSDVTAGEEASFELQYYPMGGKQIKDLQVWYEIERQIVYSASCPVLAVTKHSESKDTTDRVREFQFIQSFSHDENNWSDTKKAYFFTGNFPTSYTLRPTDWKNPEEFDKNKFTTYFPAGFGEEFQDSVYAKAQVLDLRKILTVTNPRMTPDVFLTHVDSIKDENAGRYVYWIKPASEPMIKEKFYSIPYDSLFYDATTSTFKVEYEKVYSLKAKFKAVDSEGVAGFSEEKVIKLR